MKYSDQRYRKRKRRSIARATHMPHPLPSCLHWRYLPAGSSKIYCRWFRHFIRNGKVTPFIDRISRSWRFERRRPLQHVYETEGASSGPFGRNIVKGQRCAFDFENVSRGPPNSRQLRSLVERTRFKNRFVTRYRHVLVKRSARSAPFRKIGPRGGATRFKQLTCRLLRINGDLIFHSRI